MTGGGSIATACSKELMRVLTTPSRIASKALKGGIRLGRHHPRNGAAGSSACLCLLDVHADRIGITLRCPTPPPTEETNETTTQKGGRSSSHNHYHYYSVGMKRKGSKKIPDSSRQRLSNIVREHNVSGFVVSWPLQNDTGLMGASCGRTLHAIEELMLESSSSPSSKHQQRSGKQPHPLFTPSRPICFWSFKDHHHQQYDNHHRADSFGRSSAYAKITENKNVHSAKKEQYHQDESIDAADVWDDFVRHNFYWPIGSTDADAQKKKKKTQQPFQQWGEEALQHQHRERKEHRPGKGIFKGYSNSICRRPPFPPSRQSPYQEWEVAEKDDDEEFAIVLDRKAFPTTAINAKLDEQLSNNNSDEMKTVTTATRTLINGFESRRLTGMPRTTNKKNISII